MKKRHHFKSVIYKKGINFCVDVPIDITSKLTKDKGYIKVKGTINGYAFTKSLVPVRNSPYRLFVNMKALKGAVAKVGDEVNFVIEQDNDISEKKYNFPTELKSALEKYNLVQQFDNLSAARKKNIFKYLDYIKTSTTLQKNIEKIINQLKMDKTDVRIP